MNEPNFGALAFCVLMPLLLAVAIMASKDKTDGTLWYAVADGQQIGPFTTKREAADWIKRNESERQERNEHAESVQGNGFTAKGYEFERSWSLESESTKRTRGF